MPISPKSFRQTERKRENEQYRGTKQQRGYGGEWERISRLFRAQHPVCQVCENRVADDIDHILPFRSLTDPLRTSWNNLQALCRRCHHAKTRAGRAIVNITWVCGPSGSGKSTYVDTHKGNNDLVYDMDRVGEVLVATQGRGTQRDTDVLQMLIGIRDDIISRIRRGMIARRSWVIMVDDDQARLRAIAGDILIVMDSSYNAQNVPIS